MKNRYIAYALAPNFPLTAYLLINPNEFGFAGAGLLLGHSWLTVMLLSGLFFSLSADAKRWRPLFIGLGLLGQLACALGIGFFQYLKPLSLGGMAFFPLCFLGYLVGVLVEKTIQAILYLNKNFFTLRQKSLEFLVLVLKDAVG